MRCVELVVYTEAACPIPASRRLLSIPSRSVLSSPHLPSSYPILTCPRLTAPHWLHSILIYPIPSHPAFDEFFYSPHCIHPSLVLPLPVLPVPFWLTFGNSLGFILWLFLRIIFQSRDPFVLLGFGALFDTFRPQIWHSLRRLLRRIPI